MAIVSDRKMIYERKIAELQTQLTEVSGKAKEYTEFIRFHWLDVTMVSSRSAFKG